MRHLFISLFMLSLFILPAGCTRPFSRSADVRPPLPPHTAPDVLPSEAVQLTIVTPETGVLPGEPVKIGVAADGTVGVTALRLAIDGADTGWRAQDTLDGGELWFEWTAGEPDVYQIVGQARIEDGSVEQHRLALQVHAPHEFVPQNEAAPAGTPSPAPRSSAAGTVEFAGTSEEPLPSTGATPLPAKLPELPRIWESTVTLPTYPYEEYLTAEVDARYAWPYARFDAQAFSADQPAPESRTYAVVVLENEYLRLWILPELGGRIWQVEHKPTGQTMFYQNPVVKPSPWGPPQQMGWLALGGMEWGAPVYEHGYDWGTPWDVSTLTLPDGALRAVISTPADGRLLTVSIEVTLPPNAAYFEVAPRLHNRSDTGLHYDFWLNAMLAPGKRNAPSADTRIVVPGRMVQVHSRGDDTLPVDARPMRWPWYGTQNLSILGTYQHYLGYFEYPQAQGPFVGVYDRVADAGAVRVYPPEIARGSKIFSLGWADPIPSHYYTDDKSAYVEVHGGVARSFFEQAWLAPSASIAWREQWYPVHGLNGLTHADAWGAIYVEGAPRVHGTASPSLAVQDNESVTVRLYPVHPSRGEVQILAGGQILAAQPFSADPYDPATVTFSAGTLGAVTSRDAELAIDGVNQTGSSVVGAFLVPTEIRIVSVVDAENGHGKMMDSLRTDGELGTDGELRSVQLTDSNIIMSYYPGRN